MGADKLWWVPSQRFGAHGLLARMLHSLLRKMIHCVWCLWTVSLGLLIDAHKVGLSHGVANIASKHIRKKGNIEHLHSTSIVECDGGHVRSLSRLMVWRKLRSAFAASHVLASGLPNCSGFKQINEIYFDTLKVEVADKTAIKKAAECRNQHFRYFESNHVGISWMKLQTLRRLESIPGCFWSLTPSASPSRQGEGSTPTKAPNNIGGVTLSTGEGLGMGREFMTHPVCSTPHQAEQRKCCATWARNWSTDLEHGGCMIPLASDEANATTEDDPCNMVDRQCPSFPHQLVQNSVGYQTDDHRFRELVERNYWFHWCFASASTAAVQGQVAPVWWLSCAVHQSRSWGYKIFHWFLHQHTAPIQPAQLWLTMEK